MKFLFLIITIALIIFRPTPSVVVEEEKVSSAAAVHDVALPSPVATEEKTVYVPQSEIEKKICELWKNECDVAVAVFKAESGLRADAQGWNCYYFRVDGSRYSAACKAEDRAQAWSVDCGVTQMNVAGQTCPAEYFDPAWNIEKAYAWKYVTRGNTFTAWVAYTKGRYLTFL